MVYRILLLLRSKKSFIWRKLNRDKKIFMMLCNNGGDDDEDGDRHSTHSVSDKWTPSHVSL